MTKNKIIAGIDVGSAKITTLIASQPEEGVTPKIIGISSLPSKGIRKGQIVNIEETSSAVVESVEAAERMAGYNLNRAYVSLGGSHIESQNSHGVVAVAQPEGEISAEDIVRVIEAARAISLPSSREIVHVLPRTYTVDGQEGIKDPRGMTGVRLEVETHLITGSTTSIRNLTKCLSEIGIETQGLVASSLAAAESTLTETEKELGVVLLDIGGGTTSLIIYLDGAPYYTSVLPVGAKNVTNDLAIGLRISLDAAEKLKVVLSSPAKKISLPSQDEPTVNEDEINLEQLGIVDDKKTVSRKTLIEGIIRPRLNEMFSMVDLEIERSQTKGLTPSGMVICGGGSLTINAVESAKRILSMPVRLGQPTGLTGLVDQVSSPEFASAQGLLLWACKQEGRSASGFRLNKLSKNLPRIPVKGAASKLVEIVKSLLP